MLDWIFLVQRALLEKLENCNLGLRLVIDDSNGSVFFLILVFVLQLWKTASL